jgi:Raf kinase inhibitor-like YbhB/YbcL family protein
MKSELLPIVLKCKAFEEGKPIPSRYTGDGPDVSPPLTWSGVPHETKSLALICDDPDAPHGTWTHWILFNLPPETRELPEGIAQEKSLPDGSLQGTNGFGNLGYGGPAPPPGKPHRYYFHLYALDSALSLPAGAKREEVLAALTGHIVAQGRLMGKYGRASR